MAFAWIKRVKLYAGEIRLQTYTLYYAARDIRTPWYAKFIVASIVAYAISPIDLIPDFIPIIGFVDELILLPLALILARKLISDEVMSDCRKKSETLTKDNKPTSLTAAIMIVFIWLVLALFTYRYFQSQF